MNNILGELYDGEYSAFGPYNKNAPHEKAMGKALDLENQVQLVLPPEIQPIFEELKSAARDALDECGKADFEAGFRLGVQLMLAALPGEWTNHSAALPMQPAAQRNATKSEDAK